MGFYEKFFILHFYNLFKENLKLLIYSINLKYAFNIGIYFLREKALFTINYTIKDDTYNIPHSNSELYKSLIANETKKIFSEGNVFLEYITSTNFKFSKNYSYILTEKTYDIEMLYNNFYIKKVTSSFYTTLIHVYSSFCNLLSKSDEVYVNDPNLYNFIHNSFNNIGDMLNMQIKIFESELLIRKLNITIRIICYIILFFILHIIIYLIIYNSYFSIAKKKASYISVFYGIVLPLINSSIKKCQIFINKMNQDKDNPKIKEINDDSSSYISSLEDNNLNKINTENNYERKNKTIKTI